MGSVLQYVYTRHNDGPADFVQVSRTGARWPSDARDRSDEGRADALRMMFLEMQSGETLLIGPGKWNNAQDICLLPPCIVTGAGKGVTILSSSQEDQRHHCGVDQTRGSSITDMSIIWRPKDDQVRGGQAIGFAADPYTGAPVICSMRRVAVHSFGSVAWYIWGGGKFHKFYAQDTDFFAGRIGVELGMASASDCASILMDNCRVNVDFQVYGGAGGDIGQRTIGVLLRGGSGVMNGGEINVLGYGGDGVAGSPNQKPFELAVCAATSSLGAPLNPGDPLPEWGNGEWPSLVLNNVRSRVIANGATDALDAWGQIGKTGINGGSGSGRNGDWLYRGNVKLGPRTQGVEV